MIAKISADVVSSVESLSRIFTIVLALSIGEAFKQFVSDKTEMSGKIFGWKLPLLVAFIALVVPFSHGMTRYFHHVYLAVAPPEAYSTHVLIDTILFTVESAMFFILSRSLSANLWREFFLRFTLLLFLDTLWGFFSGAKHEVSTMKWVEVNFFTLLVILGVCATYWLVKRFTSLDLAKPTTISTPPAITITDKVGAILVAVFVVARTVLDYAYSFEFYFPNP